MVPNLADKYHALAIFPSRINWQQPPGAGVGAGAIPESFVACIVILAPLTRIKPAIAFTDAPCPIALALSFARSQRLLEEAIGVTHVRSAIAYFMIRYYLNHSSFVFCNMKLRVRA
jgi:hypothetical protein